MAAKDDKGNQADKTAARRAREAAALRENLKRRKAQSRARAEPTTEPPRDRRRDDR